LAAIGIILWLAPGNLAAQGRSGSKRFTLSGTVVDGSNQPMAGVEVSLNTSGHDVKVDPAVSDAQGRFTFSGLPPGEYSLWAEGGFGSVTYGETAETLRGSLIRIGGESGDKSVVFRILARGSIEGAVKDEFGEPMANLTVSVQRPRWQDGRTTMANIGQKSTDDRGRYRFGNLAPGNYVVCAGQGPAAPVPGPVDFATRADNRYYSRTCNRSFQLSPGQRAQVDLNPAAGATATLHGHVRNLPAQTGFSVYLLPDDDGQARNSPVGAYVDVSQGTFTIRGVQPGRYMLRAQSYSNSASQKSLAGEAPVDVGSSDIDGIEVELGGQGAVEVALHGVADEQIKEVSATLRGGGSRGSTRGYAQAKDGSFQFQGVTPGNYYLLLHAPEESCVASVKLGDTEMRGAAFRVAAGAVLHFDVAVTQNCGAIQARAVRDGAPVSGAKMVLLVSGTPGDPGELREEFADDEGEFTFSGLAPGRYLAWAWAVEGQGAIAGPTSLAAVEQKATVVDVAAGDPVKVDVPLLAAEGNGQ
jgi:hypothetical protein